MSSIEQGRLGSALLTKLLKSENGTKEYRDLNLFEGLFAGSQASRLFEFIDTHYHKYRELPSMTLCDAEGVGEYTYDGEECAQYYYDKCKGIHIQNSLSRIISEEAKGIDAENSEQIAGNINKRIAKVLEGTSENRITNIWEEGAAQVIKEHNLMSAGLNQLGVSIGWPTFDKAVGGLLPGDMVGIVARLGEGKSFIGGYIANHISINERKKVLFVTTEMSADLVSRRAVAMATSKSISALKKGNLPSKSVVDLVEKVKVLRAGPSLDLMEATIGVTVDDIIEKARYLKSEVVVIDGAYLLDYDTDRYINDNEKVAKNAKLLKKKLAEGLNVPIICMYQLNREAASKIKKGETVGVEDISFSDAIGQACSLIIGIFGSDGTIAEGYKDIYTMKAREGAIPPFKVNWIFDKPPYMDFSEKDDSTEGMSFNY